MTLRAFLRVLVPCTLLLASCSGYPRDIANTLDHVRSSHQLRVGIIDGAGSSSDAALARFYVARVGRETGSAPTIETGSAEPLLARLQAGDLDMVVGELASDTPWITEVAIIEPLAKREMGKRSFGFGAVARNGENAWIILLERLARDKA